MQSSSKTGFKEKLTAQVRSTIIQQNHNDPVGVQYFYDEKEEHQTPFERNDPIGDGVHTSVKGIVHRYPDRALLKITDICAVHCRYCFRKEMINNDHGVLAPQDLKNALAYIENTPRIQEIILTGGDPFTLDNKTLCSLMERLEAIQHLDIIRFHTRIPVAQPKRINEALLHCLSNTKKALYVVIHVNHVQEINQTVEEALLKLSKTGAVLLSQSVLLKNVNDSVDVLEQLYRKLLKNRVKPYYLHHPDLVKGTDHFQVSFETGQKIMKELRGRVSGLAQPHYVLDIPGGFGKMPLTESCLHKDKYGQYIIEDYHGNKHNYPPKSEGV